MQHVQCDAGKGDLETEERSGLPKRCTSQPHRAGLATLRQSTWVVRFNRNCMKRSRLSRSRVRLLFHHRSNVDASKRLLFGEGREKHSRKPLLAQSLAVRNIPCRDVLVDTACRQLFNVSVQESSLEPWLWDLG